MRLQWDIVLRHRTDFIGQTARCYLLVELYVGEDGMHPPGLAEHGAERQREPDAEHPRLQLPRPHANKTVT